MLDTEQKQLKGNIRKIYFYRMLLGMIFPAPVVVLFWQNHGMSLTQIMILALKILGGTALIAGTIMLLILHKDEVL